jgi:hypothetical protein
MRRVLIAILLTTLAACGSGNSPSDMATSKDMSANQGMAMVKFSIKGVH